MLGQLRRSAANHAAASLSLVVVAFFIAWFGAFSPSASVTSDDGAYALHVRSIDVDGDWSVPHVLADVDPEGLTYPYQNSHISKDGFFPAPRHAAWILTLTAGHEAGGTVGMRVVPVVGLCVAISAAVAMAKMVHGDVAGWVAGGLTVASPLLFDALQLWAHAAVAGGVAAAMLGALHLTATSFSLRWLVVTVLAAATASAWRADGLIFAIAIALVVTLVGVRSKRWALTLGGAAVGTVSLTAFLLAARLVRSVAGDASDATVGGARGSGSVVGRISGALHTFVSVPDSAVPFALVIVALGLVSYAAVKARMTHAREAAVLLCLAAGVWLLRMVAFPREMASGLLGAWPVAVLVFLRPMRCLRRPEWHLAAMTGIAALGIAATQYDEGGGLNWGGRFVAPAIPALAVLVAGSLVHAAQNQDVRRLVVPSVVALAVACATAGLVFDASVRLRHQRVVDRVADIAVPVVTSSVPLPRLAWTTYPDVQWLRVPTKDDGSENPERLLLLLRAADIERVALYGVSEHVASTLSGGDQVPAPMDAPVVVDLSDMRDD